MKDKKQLTFLITHFNRPNELKRCIESILNLNLTDYEIVVSDDSSDEEVVERIKKYPIDNLILSNVNIGLAGNLNKGIKLSKGKFLFYCQEDFVINPSLKDVLVECLDILDTNKIDMIRFISTYQFKKLIGLSKNVNLIPKFSFRNFLYNARQYSDTPFITKKKFYTEYGYYLENTSGDYGETEYAIRIFKSKARVGLALNNYVSFGDHSTHSVIDRKIGGNLKSFRKYKVVYKYARSIRLHFEMIFYRKNSRGLITYKNYRQK